MKSLKQSESIFTGLKGTADELIPLLQKAQAHYGYLSDELMSKVALFLKIPASRVYAVATFYAQFRFSPIGKTHIVVCRGTACHVKGAKGITREIENVLGIKEGQTTTDGKYSLETVACIGACGLAPTVLINNKTYGRMSIKKITKVLEDIRAQKKHKK